MNILDILILAVLGFSLCAGLYKGFLNSLLATGALVGSWFGARAVYERVAQIALSNRTLLTALGNYLEADTFLPDGGVTAVSAISGNVGQIDTIVAAATKRVPFIGDALRNNLMNQSFQNLNIGSVAEYFNQTLWEGVFNVAAFILCFLVIYLLCVLVINLIDNVFRFPQLRAVDWLLGGLFGLARGVVFALLIIEIGLPLLGIVQADFAQNIQETSKILPMVKGIDLMRIGDMLKSLVGA